MFVIVFDNGSYNFGHGPNSSGFECVELEYAKKYLTIADCGPDMSTLDGVVRIAHVDDAEEFASNLRKLHFNQ